MIGFGPVSRPLPRRAAVMRAGANGPVGGGSTSENHRMRDVWPHWNRLLSRPFPACRVIIKSGQEPKIGAKVVSHGRYVTFQLAEVAVPRRLFSEIPSLIARLRAPPEL